MAEFAIYQYLTSKGLKCSPPDLTILPAAKKSFAADLTCEGNVIHVKSQTVESAKRYSASWLFQKSDKILSLPSENSLMSFCIVDNCQEYCRVTIKAIVRVLDLIENNVLKEPKVFRYRLTKNAIYLDDVLNSGINLWSLK